MTIRKPQPQWWLEAQQSGADIQGSWLWIHTHLMIGRTGRVTGRVAPGAVGEVTLQIRGGSEAFYAYASDPHVIIEKGVKVIVDDHQPPLTVFVSPVEPAPPAPQDRPFTRSLIQDTIRTPAPRHSYT